ncbi:hypothetical protein K438DRAFT_1762858 [Mycena galopus ATCC 62051]|nr:hypothetical protein K438DRAFT_1762858 [Mycena galopus ATCC 62051]
MTRAWPEIWNAPMISSWKAERIIKKPSTLGYRLGFEIITIGCYWLLGANLAAQVRSSKVTYAIRWHQLRPSSPVHFQVSVEQARTVVAPLVACSTRTFFLLGAIPGFFELFAFFARLSASIFSLAFLFSVSVTGIAVVGAKIEESSRRKAGYNTAADEILQNVAIETQNTEEDKVAAQKLAEVQIGSPDGVVTKCRCTRLRSGIVEHVKARLRFEGHRLIEERRLGKWLKMLWRIIARPIMWGIGASFSLEIVMRIIQVQQVRSAGVFPRTLKGRGVWDTFRKE